MTLDKQIPGAKKLDIHAPIELAGSNATEAGAIGGGLGGASLKDIRALNRGVEVAGPPGTAGETYDQRQQRERDEIAKSLYQLDKAIATKASKETHELANKVVDILQKIELGKNKSEYDCSKEEARQLAEAFRSAKNPWELEGVVNAKLYENDLKNGVKDHGRVSYKWTKEDGSIMEGSGQPQESELKNTDYIYLTYNRRGQTKYGSSIDIQGATIPIVNQGKLQTIKPGN